MMIGPFIVEKDPNLSVKEQTDVTFSGEDRKVVTTIKS
jgi:hypothetical protein